jgi:hypothetical protein
MLGGAAALPIAARAQQRPMPAVGDYCAAGFRLGHVSVGWVKSRREAILGPRFCPRKQTSTDALSMSA